MNTEIFVSLLCSYFCLLVDFKLCIPYTYEYIINSHCEIISIFSHLGQQPELDKIISFCSREKKYHQSSLRAHESAYQYFLILETHTDSQNPKTLRRREITGHNKNYKIVHLPFLVISISVNLTPARCSASPPGLLRDARGGPVSGCLEASAPAAICHIGSLKRVGFAGPFSATPSSG